MSSPPAGRMARPAGTVLLTPFAFAFAFAVPFAFGGFFAQVHGRRLLFGDSRAAEHRLEDERSADVQRAASFSALIAFELA